tara:strand:+ start:660 stop:1094 length:435 start_codon:yes stop_codon:yes gene_type:complete
MLSEIKPDIINILLVILVLFFMYQFTWGSKLNQLDEWNKKNKKKFKTVEDFLAYQEKLDIEKKEKDYRDAIKNEKKLLREERKSQKIIHKPIQEEKRLAREERKIDKEVSSSDLGASLKRLKKMYKDGHLSKVEFEKAKNKLLK